MTIGGNRERADGGIEEEFIHIIPLVFCSHDEV